MIDRSNTWTRRQWVARTVTAAVAVPLVGVRRHGAVVSHMGSAEAAVPLSSEQRRAWEQLAQRAVDSAMRAGAQYADARLTRTVIHQVDFTDISAWQEYVGVGVRALVNGHWGFGATPSVDTAAADRLARDAVAQAKFSARGLPRTVELGTIPPAVGMWKTPIAIDPFAIPFEEKVATLDYWRDVAGEFDGGIDSILSRLVFMRRESVVTTSEGARFTQTLYESGGRIVVLVPVENQIVQVELEKLTPMAKGWEVTIEADIVRQIRGAPDRAGAQVAADRNPKPAQVGRYTLVCDGATMATLLDQTLGVATQLDRALGYEANAGGTSFLNNPLAMLGTFQVASPLVTITANRSMSGGLATVKWDDEGVEPDDFTLVKDGVLADYQTTREQSAWLAPYYQKVGKPVRSHGCANTEGGLAFPLQQTPNLELTPSTTDVTLDQLMANVKTGILLTEGDTRLDFQARTGILIGKMREIVNGKPGRVLRGGAVQFDTLDLWKHVSALGGPSTRMALAVGFVGEPGEAAAERVVGIYPAKGEPGQHARSTVRAVATTITNQAVIDLMRKA